MSRALTLEQVERAAHETVVACGASEWQAAAAARSIPRAELEGTPFIDLGYCLPAPNAIILMDQRPILH